MDEFLKTQVNSAISWPVGNFHVGLAPKFTLNCCSLKNLRLSTVIYSGPFHVFKHLVETNINHPSVQRISLEKFPRNTNSWSKMKAHSSDSLSLKSARVYPHVVFLLLINTLLVSLSRKKKAY